MANDPAPETKRPLTRAAMTELEEALGYEQRTRQRITAERDAFLADRDRWREAHRDDKEAQAIERCVAALTDMRGDRATTYHYTDETTDSPTSRVLHYLAERFGVPWPTPEIPVEIHASASEDIRSGDSCIVTPRNGQVARNPNPYG